MTRDIVLAISKSFSSRICNAARFFVHSERERERERESSLVERIECSKKTSFGGDCCDRNQAIILVG